MITNPKQIENLKGVKLLQKIAFGKKYRDKYLWDMPDSYIRYMGEQGAWNTEVVLEKKRVAQKLHEKQEIKRISRPLALFNPENISRYILDDIDKVKRNAAQLRELMRFNGRSNVVINGCIGSGKTILGIELLKLNMGPKEKALIVCPISVFNSVWVSKIREFFPEKTVCILHGKVKDRIVQLNHTNYDIYITNPEALRDEEYLMALCSKSFIFGLYDEAHLYLSNHSANTYKHIKILIDHLPHNWPLTGSFVTDGREWKAADIAHAFGVFGQMSISAVYKKYFELDSYYKPCRLKSDDLKLELLEIFAANSMTITEDELELPEPIFETRDVPMSGDILKAYKDAQRAFKAKEALDVNGHDLSIPAKIAEITRLRQISGGTMVIKDEEGNVLHRHRYKDNGKVKMVHDIVSEFNDDDKFIIICQYTEEIALMKNEFKDAVIIQGGMTMQARNDAISDFTCGPARCMIMQLDTAIGIDGLQEVCRYMIFYSNTYSFEKFRQAYGRVYRSGTLTNAVIFLINSILPDGMGSIDEIMQEVREGKEENKNFCTDYIYKRIAA